MNGRRLRRVLLAGLLVVLALQLWPGPGPDNPPTESEPEWTPEVAAVMRRACYDCHSNETRWPWYSYVAPVSWSLAGEVQRGRSALNFSTWRRYRPHARRLILQRAVARAWAGEMAPQGYRLAHPEAALTSAERDLLRRWLDDYRESIRWQAAPNWQMFRFPAQECTLDAPLGPGSWRARDQRGSRPLELHAALLQLDGTTLLTGGARGSGAVLLFGEARLKGPVDPEVRVLGPRQPPLAASFRLRLPDLGEAVLSFCRDDGELGERNERSFHVLYGHGQFLILEPELELGRTAASPAEALQATEAMLAQDPSTNLKTWRRRFRAAWRAELERLTRETGGAVFEVHPGERGPR